MTEELFHADCKCETHDQDQLAAALIELLIYLFLGYVARYRPEAMAKTIAVMDDLRAHVRATTGAEARPLEIARPGQVTH
jgi:hypothetical protein